MKVRRPRHTSKHPDFFIRITDPGFRPYVTALGQFTLAWNNLQNSLAFLFLVTMGDEVANQNIAVWSALKSDRSQRDILLAATKNNTFPAIPIEFVSDVDWLCKEVNRLEDLRNDATHAPLYAHRRINGEFLVLPATGFGNARAAKLIDKDILAEFRFGRDVAGLLAQFTVEIADGLRHILAGEIHEWPSRPKLPPKPPRKS